MRSRAGLTFLPIVALTVACGSSEEGGQGQPPGPWDAGANASDANSDNDALAVLCDGGCQEDASSDATSPFTCGDGLLSEEEACDDRDTEDGDGCSADCMVVEPGWMCPIPGLRCEATECGDGIVAGAEECDFPPGAPVDGCSDSCRIESGYDCDPVSLTCTPTECGDGTVSRGETCEDGNDLPFDGCYRCAKEPSCASGVCEAVCGDGQRFASEACDDGNLRPGDGCSENCEVELGYACEDIPVEPTETVDLPVLVRDFIGKDNQLAGAAYHEDFNRHSGSGVLGIVDTALGPDGRPVYSCPGGDCDANPGHLYLDSAGRPNTSTRENFDQWYRNAPGVNLESVLTLSLASQSDGTYQWDSADPSVNGGLTYFDPVGTGGWVSAGKEQRVCNPLRNVSFTSETHFWFEYQGGERFDFAGDDDTWVFLNGKLAIDLGGLHTPRSGYFSLNADPDGPGPEVADGRGTVWGAIENVSKSIDFELIPGGTYEVVMFQAERNECGSNFKITLKDFRRPRSSCKSTCGDGIVASDEVCDDGINDGSYSGCMPGCLERGPFCGDGDVQPPEECDDGNQDNSDACSNGCLNVVPK